MSNNKMLIDASHPEETRVAVVRGNRIEEFDFESQEKRQLRGNIYLAKVTRVEPSLQAAFVDYGGNRHGFLAFSEIHPDYYQIPVADRQALLEQEAAEARANKEEEEAEAGDEDAKPRRGRKRSRRKKPEEGKADDSAQEDSDEPGDDADVDDNQDTGDTDDESADHDDADDSDDGKTVSAIVETDSISEPLPGDDEDEGEDASDDATQNNDEAVAKEEEKPAKPKRRTSRRKKKPEDEKAEEVEASASDAQAEAKPESADSDETADSEPKKPARKRGRGKAKAEAAKSDDTGSDDGDSDAPNGEEVESVGQEDALEEVPERRRNRRQYKIQEVIKRRQVLLIQVVKEERGTKGAALTTYLSLAGRYSVLMPNTARGGGISRKITNSNDRKRLKAIASDLTVPDGMGVILRTAGASRTKAEIKRDFEYLMRLWEKVRNLTLSSTAPCLVYEEGNLIKRSIRDLYNKEIGEVLVSGEEGYKEAKEFMGMLMPSHAKNVKQYQETQSIFSRYNVEAHLDRMLTPQVTLKSGGYLVINQTEALVAIDVNSGRSTREHSIEDTATRTNLEAAEEVARQLRLRDLAGLIVIDFIDMEEKRNNRAVEKKLKECLKNDRARIQVGRISHFGLLEMSRQRIRASVLESTMDQCPHCGGTGYVRSDSAIALHVFRSIEEHLAKHNRHDITVKTTPSIAINLLNTKRQALGELESHYDLKIVIEGSTDILGQDFSIEKGPVAKGGSTAAGYGQSDDSGNEASDQNRGRGKNRRNRSDNRDTDQADTEVKADSTEATDDDQTDEERPRKRRRRGKRGGRRNRNGANDTENMSEDGTETGGADTAPDAQNKDSQDEKSDASGNDSEEKKPARRTRRKKAEAEDTGTQAADTVSAEPVEDAASDDTSQQDAESPKESVSAANENDATSPGRQVRRPRNSSASSEPQVTVKSSNPDTEDAAEDDGKKKRGWWNRGGGFF